MARPARRTPASAREELHTTRNTNGTGAFRLITREPDVRTVLTRNADWWGWREEGTGNVTEIVFRPIASDATRIAALLSGEVDFRWTRRCRICSACAPPPAWACWRPEVRTIFLAMDVARPELLYSDVRGRNLLADLRVRRALYQAIDIQAIQRVTMRGQRPCPTGTLFPRTGERLCAGGGCACPQDAARASRPAGRGRLSERLRDHARLPQQPLHQR